MRKIILSTAIVLLSCLSFNVADAQLHISLGFNIGSQPDWGPVGYDHVDYYYIPDIDAYYDVPTHEYVYFSYGRWIHARYLPERLARHFDRYRSYKVVVNEHDPWRHHAEIRAKYYRYRGRHSQAIIRDSHDRRYRDHWRGDRDDHDHGHDHGRYHDRHGH